MSVCSLTKLCPNILFDWRLFCERGQQKYIHAHFDGSRVDECEANYLKKVEKNVQNEKNDILLNLGFGRRKSVSDDRDFR